jgi:hypothetical protein
MLLTDHDGDWDSYLDAVYGAFRADFVVGRPRMAGIPCGLRHPELIEGKEGTF